MICPYCGTENQSVEQFCKKCGRALKKQELRGATTCQNHPNRRATTSCGQCGAWLCDNCAIDTGGIAFCHGCVDTEEPSEAERTKKLVVVDAETAVRVGFGTRLTAGVVDWIILLVEGLILAGFFWLVTGVLPLQMLDGHAPPSYWLYWALMLVSVAGYFIVLTALGGQTLGKQAMSITVVCEDGTAPLLREAGVAFVGSLVSLCVFGLGYLAILSDPERQAWHDRWARTVVVSLE